MYLDGFSLDDKRTLGAVNDIPDVLLCWKNRADDKFLQGRERRITELRKALEPPKAERLELWEEIDKLTYQQVLDENLPEPDPLMGYPMLREDEPFDPHSLADAQAQLAELDAQIQPLQAELDQLSRQFWVTRQQVKANKYDLSASHYREVDQDGMYYEKPAATLERLLKLEDVMADEIRSLESLMQ